MRRKETGQMVDFIVECEMQLCFHLVSSIITNTNYVVPTFHLTRKMDELIEFQGWLICELLDVPLSEFSEIRESNEESEPGDCYTILP